MNLVRTNKDGAFMKWLTPDFQERRIASLNTTEERDQHSLLVAILKKLTAVISYVTLQGNDPSKLHD
jgi:hypothetical protein